MAAVRSPESTGFPERRTQERINLRCPVLLFRNSGPQPVNGVTVNISSKGLYWISALPLAPSETLKVWVFITPVGLPSPGKHICLECEAAAVRMERRQAGYGVGARIERYTVSVHTARTSFGWAA